MIGGALYEVAGHAAVDDVGEGALEDPSGLPLGGAAGARGFGAGRRPRPPQPRGAGRTVRGRGDAPVADLGVGAVRGGGLGGQVSHERQSWGTGESPGEGAGGLARPASATRVEAMSRARGRYAEGNCDEKRTPLRMNHAHSTGSRVRVTINEPTRANIMVSAIGLNSVPEGPVRT